MLPPQQGPGFDFRPARAWGARVCVSVWEACARHSSQGVLSVRSWLQHQLLKSDEWATRNANNQRGFWRRKTSWFASFAPPASKATNTKARHETLRTYSSG